METWHSACCFHMRIPNSLFTPARGRVFLHCQKPHFINEFQTGNGSLECVISKLQQTHIYSVTPSWEILIASNLTNKKEGLLRVSKGTTQNPLMLTTDLESGLYNAVMTKCFISLCSCKSVVENWNRSTQCITRF